MVTKLEDILDVNNLNKMRRDGYIRQARHPELPLVSECYTKQTMFERAWNNETRICRGLIWNTESGDVIARPFAKFFNYGEPSAPELKPDEWVKAYDKLDGSLGIVYDTPDGPAVATKNSFGSPQAVHATKLLRTRYRGWNPRPGVTTLVEIVYPENRIVLDYNDTDDLFHLAGIWNDTGETRLYDHWARQAIPFPEARFVTEGRFADLAEYFSETQRPNSEGVVLWAPTLDIRLKIKQQDYIELHKVATGLNKKQLWKWLSEGKSIDEILADVPEELHDWAFPIMQDLNTKYTEWDLYITEMWMELRDEGWPEYRELMAELVSDFPAWLSHGIFLIMDGNEDRYNEMLWKLVKPSGEKR